MQTPTSGPYGSIAAIVAILVLALVPHAATAESEDEKEKESKSRLSDEVIPYQPELAPPRPPTLEAGPKFLGTGKIGAGFEIPGGAVWQPQALIWGTARTGVQAFDPNGDSDARVSDWSNRLDIFGELEVSPTERIVVGWSVFRDEGMFSGCQFEPNEGDGCDTEFDPEPQAAFVEFNFGEVFPNLDPNETRALDIEFSGGRQPLLFQDGILINDVIDSVAITRNNINFGGTTNTRVTFLGGFNDIHRADNRTDGQATLGALLVETDTPLSTINLDLVFVGSGNDDAGNSFHGGISFIQRLGPFATLFRALLSQRFSGDTAATRNGGLFFAEINWVPTGTHDNLYLTTFVGINEFSSAARDPTTGGPLGRAGVLFAAVGLGGYGAPIGNRVNDSAGGAIGYQLFLNRNRTWLNFEVGGRKGWGGGPDGDGSVAAGLAFQQAILQNFIFRVDSFIGHREDEDLGWGARCEWLVKF